MTLSIQRHARFPLMATALAVLLAGLWAGLVRLGVPMPGAGARLAALHGPMMLSGFLGTVIGVERALALEARWPYAAPALTAAGALALLLGAPAPLPAVLITLGSLGLVAIFGVIVGRLPALFSVTMLLGAAAWAVGNVLWAWEEPLYRVVLWWVGFLVLTVVGERMELGRVQRLTAVARGWFWLGVAAVLAGLALSLIAGDAGARLAGAGMIALAGWLLRHDIGRRTLRQGGLSRFMATCLLTGFVWLSVGGALLAAYGQVVGGPRYDALLHALLLGFTFAMIFGHAPIILAAVLGRPLAYYPRFYSHLALLHATLALRVGSDLAGWADGRQWGGALNVAVVLLFLANTAWALRPIRRAPTLTPATRPA